MPRVILGVEPNPMRIQTMPSHHTTSHGRNGIPTCRESARPWLGLFVIVLWLPSLALADGPRTGKWNAWLESPGGKLTFGLEFSRKGDNYRAWIVNGPERIEIPTVTIKGEDIVLGFDHYDSKIIANMSEGMLDGEWVKTGVQGKVTRMVFSALHRASQSLPCGTGLLMLERKRNGARELSAGRWSVQFSKSDDPAVAVFERNESLGYLTGTFLTTTGDYRYLAETIAVVWELDYKDDLHLSCFDGAHAFLFKAKLQEDGTLKGDFWSRDTWHETWTATRDPNAKLPDAFGLTKWTGNAKLSDLSFFDLDGQKRPLDELAIPGTVRIIEIFGSWCPNCNDATKYLMELDRKYRAKGLSIVGLAFELSGDRKRDTKQLKRYINHHDIKYPVLLAGVSDKKKATEALPIIDRVRAYPTFLFVDRAGKVRSIYTGFNGPATGEEYTRLRSRFESLITEMLQVK